MEYLIKASAVVAIFYLFYKVFLQRDTFFQYNRCFLLIGLLVALCIPMVVIPIYIEYTPIDVSHLTFNEVSNTPTKTGLDIFDYVMIAYVLGVTFFSIRFLIQIASLAKVIIKNKKDIRNKYIYVETNADISPFSFFNWIVYNPEQFNKTELDQIISHEKVHAKQYHSIDILLTHLASIALWFNPFIWLYNNELKQNLEFLADSNTVNDTTCKKSYQYTLLKTSVPSHQLALSNNFYNSLIKKRIVMLQKSKSKQINKLKYALIIPLLVVFLMSFNTKDIYIEKAEPIVDMVSNTIPEYLQSAEDKIVEKPVVKSKSKTEKQSVNSNKLTSKKDIEAFIITKKTSDSDLDGIIKKAKNKGVTLKFKSVKRNTEGEIISIKIEASGKESNASYHLNSDETITPIKITFSENGKNISIGNADAKKKSITYVIKDGDKIHEVKGAGNGTENIFITNEDSVYEIQGDSVRFISGDKGNNKFKKRIKQVDVRKNKDDGDTVEIIVKNEGLSEEEDVITVKGNNSGGKSYKVKAIGQNKDSKKIVIKSDDGTEPIYIVNGKVVKPKDFKTLNSDDIKTVNVLKGEAAVKKHGEKAKNGVVEITTKE
ncbi:M56 family metallopeptidase [uncultured Algibacter sp.]|uniref:M56 family metallopeptidase n=1 Tax=uncultured Algibacter sp. TaxID=298659 RepID=UPI002610717C|nr:M56 family metallopeptidase [uncultured Algibacter sp.]